MHSAAVVFALLQAAPAGPLFRTEAVDAHIEAAVTDGGRFVAGLGAADFIVSSGGRDLRVTAVAAGEQPLDVLLVLDVSGSMQQWLELLASYSETALALLKPGDRAGVATFGDAFALRSDLSGGIAGAVRATQQAASPRRRTGTNLDQAVQRAARHIGKAGRADARRAVIFVTDNLSPRDIEESKLLRETAKSGAIFNALLTPLPETGATLLSRTSVFHADIRRVAQATGGDIIAADDPGPALSECIRRIRARYTIYYRPEPGAGAAEISVGLSAGARVRYPDAEIRTGVRNR